MTTIYNIGAIRSKEAHQRLLQVSQLFCQHLLAKAPAFDFR